MPSACHQVVGSCPKMTERPDLGPKRMWSVTKLNSSNRYATPVNGGPVGSASGFGFVILYDFSVTVGERILSRLVGQTGYALDRHQTNGDLYWYVCDGGGTLRSVVQSVPKQYIGKVAPIVVKMNGAAISISIGYGALARTSTAITGYTAATPSPVFRLGDNPTATPSGVLSFAYFEGTPSDSQIDQYLLDARAGQYNELTASMGGTTLLKRWSVRESLPAFNNRTGNAGPSAIFEMGGLSSDTLTAVGTPELRRVDQWARNGRESYGVIGGVGLTAYETAAGAGIRGSASGFTVGVDAALNNAGLYVFLACSDSSENGWTLYSNGNSLIFAVRNGSGATTSITYDATAYANTRTRIVARSNGTTLSLWMNGISVATQAITGFTAAGAGIKMGVLNRPTSYAWPSRTTVFYLTGGDYVASDAEIFAWGSQTGRVLASIKPGSDQHTYDFSQDIAASGSTSGMAPAQILDRVGTHHLTRVGGKLVVSGGGLASFGPCYLQSTSIASGLPGIASAFWLEALVDVGATGALQSIFSNTGAGATGVTLKMASNNVPYCLLYNGSSSANAQAGVTLTVGQRYHLAVVYNGTTAQFYVNGAASGSATGSFTLWPGDQPTKLGTLYAGTSEPLTTHALRGLSGGHAVPTAGEIAAASTYALANGKVGGISGKTLRRYSIVDDIIEAGGAEPTFVKDRESGTEHLFVFGAPIQISTWKERVWPYEIDPIAYGGHTFGNGSHWASALAMPDTSFGPCWVTVPLVVTSQAVASATRILFAGNGGSSSGPTMFTGGTNTTIAFGMSGAGGGSFNTSSNASITAADVGKLMIAQGFYDGANLRLWLRRAQAVSSATSITPGVGTAPLYLGSEAGGAPRFAAGVNILGICWGIGAPSDAELCAQYDAIVAADGDVREIPGRTAHLQSFIRDQVAGAAPATLTDRKGTYHLTKAGTPALLPHYTRYHAAA